MGLYCFEGGFYIDLVCLVDCVLIMYGYFDYVWFGYGVVMVM